MIPKTLGITLDEALQAEHRTCRQAYDSDPEVRELIDIARKLEGTNRNAGTHAAGVVIANGPLTDYVPLQRVVRKGDDAGSRAGEAVVTTQWVMGDLEKVGLLKMDFLGLRTLTLLDNAVKLIEKTRGESIDLYKLPLDDPETYALLQRGDAKGVFQFESDGIRELLKRMKPDNIRDIIACMALYRPGPLEGGMVDDYVNCKHGREQAGLCAPGHGGSARRDLRRHGLPGTGHADPESAGRHRAVQRLRLHQGHQQEEARDHRPAPRANSSQGAQERGARRGDGRRNLRPDRLLRRLRIQQVAHRRLRPGLGYQTAYLKAHYTPEFMAALLSSEIEDGNKRDIMVEHIADARRLGVDVLPPGRQRQRGRLHRARRQDRLRPDGHQGRRPRRRRGHRPAPRRRAGRSRTSSTSASASISKVVNRTALEKLVKAGAFDCLGGHRAQLLHVLPRAFQSAGDRQDDLRHGQRNLFDGVRAATAPAATARPRRCPTCRSGRRRKSSSTRRKCSTSTSPAIRWPSTRRSCAASPRHTVEQLKQLPAEQEVTLGGMLTQVRFMNTKKARNGNSRYVRCKLEDFTGAVECVMWPDDYRPLQGRGAGGPRLLRPRHGGADARGAGPGAQPHPQHRAGPARAARGLYLLLKLGVHGPQHVEALGPILTRAPGGCPVFLTVRDAAGKKVDLRLGREYAVNPAAYPHDDLAALLGEDCVKLA